MLEHEADYNDLSPKLRKELEDRLSSFPRHVRYKFKLERKNPDPTNYNGAVIFPALYNLDPIQWKITDKNEDRTGKQKLKNIGIITSAEPNDRGKIEYKFARIRVKDIEKGLKVYDMTKEEDKTIVAALELHPKNANGMFPNQQMVSMFSRIDETATATKDRAERSARKKAMDAAELMSDDEVKQFADGMATTEWDSTQDILLLRNQVESLAETTPTLFNDLVGSEKIKIRSTIKRAIDNKILDYNAAECSIAWASTQQSIISLGLSTGEKSDVERLADWVSESGTKGDAAYKKMKSLIEKPATAEA